MSRTSASFAFNCFLTALIFETKQFLRGASLRALFAYNMISPLFILLSSWVPYTMLGRSGTAYFTATTGINDYLAFAIIGSSFTAFVFTTAYEGSRALRYELWSGTFEAILVTPVRRTAWVFGKMLATQVYATIAFVAVLVLGTALFGLGQQEDPQFLVAVMGLALTALSMLGLGLVLSGIAVFSRQDSLLALTVWPIFLLLGGFVFPVQALPEFVQPLAWALPITYGLDMTRRALLLSQGFANFSVFNDFVGLLISTTVLTLGGNLIFSELVKRGLRKGAFVPA